MGLGRFLGGAILGVGAILAAPVLLPVAAAAGGAVAAAGGAVAAAGTAAVGAVAAAGTAAAGAVAAAGTAAAGVAAAAGTAAAGAVTAAGTAIAGTTVGGAVVGAATTAAAGVGTAVGTAAGAVGLTSVAAVTGTTAGAAAVGTIATTGTVGAVSAISGAAKLSEASDIKDAAMSKYHQAKKVFDQQQEDTNAALKKLGEEKVKIWSSFDRFVTMYSKIRNPPTLSGTASAEELTLNADELKNIKAVSISAQELLAGGLESVSGGALIGLATSGGLVSSITVASTGTSISALSGAAASNATLAAFGGGSLASGGAGMAGGTVVLGGLTVAPMLMIGGIALNSKGKKSLEAAKDIQHEVNTAVKQMEAAEVELKKVSGLSDQILKELRKLHKKFAALMDEMEAITDAKVNYLEFSIQEKKALEKTILSLKLLKYLSMQNILDDDEKHSVLEKEVSNTLKDCQKTYQEKLAA